MPMTNIQITYFQVFNHDLQMSYVLNSMFYLTNTVFSNEHITEVPILLELLSAI